ncbi:hypothetical protein CROQUDRAFT_150983 [Cronartium quercuum f. sp. fusiforme G11]|uniref:Uncharacterized protein n=1 Tax=Cronartium quercuum f. sp. fusiforme G11 TaxID=708437 RepID=A0A9P6NY76_9BASI|nr:hypothetical protein CROQUDRAFT_150983 [Cronartium quercuum f. sp. fusiforme G11]
MIPFISCVMVIFFLMYLFFHLLHALHTCFLIIFFISQRPKLVIPRITPFCYSPAESAIESDV